MESTRRLHDYSNLKPGIMVTIAFSIEVRMREYKVEQDSHAQGFL
jgi:hypothetical protein